MIAVVGARAITAWVLWRAWRDRRRPAVTADRVLARMLAEMPADIRTDPEGFVYPFLEASAHEFARMYDMIDAELLGPR